MTEQKVPAYLLGMGQEPMTKDARISKGMFRFWLKNGASANIIFLTDFMPDSGVPRIWEHQVMLYKAGKKDYNNYFTCLKEVIGSCPLCDYSDEFNEAWRQQVRLFTVLDLTPWKSKKDNKEHKYSRKILTAKEATSEILIRKHVARTDQGQRLRGAQFNVFRGNDAKSPNVGTDFEFIKMVDLSVFPPDDIKGLDPTTLAPNRDAIIKVVEILRRAKGNPYSSIVAGEGVTTDDIAHSTEVDYGDPEETPAVVVE